MLYLPPQDHSQQRTDRKEKKRRLKEMLIGKEVVEVCRLLLDATSPSSLLSIDREAMESEGRKKKSIPLLERARAHT